MAETDAPLPAAEIRPDAAPAAESNGAAEPPRRSIREIAEAAYDDLTGGDASDGAEPSTDGRPRDDKGRFAPKDTAVAKPGEAEGQRPTQPREDRTTQPQDAHPAPQGSSSEPPANWPADVRDRFRKLPPEDQTFLLERHHGMESDYQRRVQAVRGAAEFTDALTPIFRDPVIAGSLQQNGMTPFNAIRDWAGFHKRAMSPNVNDRVGLLFDLAARMQIDPAVFAPNQSGMTQGLPKDLAADPAIKFFADHIGRTSTEVQALRAQLQTMQQAAAAEQNAEALRWTRQSIDAFADEKGPDGNRLRPDFNEHIDEIISLFRIDPQRDIREAYSTARWMKESTRQKLIAAERNSVTQQQANQRAAQAVRSNVRGMTSPVSRPGNEGAPRGLRATIEEAADSIGF